MTGNNMASENTADREFTSWRTFDIPLSLIWRALSDPNSLANWWGPKGFTNTFEEFDFRVGGNWRFLMHGPNGANYANHHTFKEIVPNQKIVSQHLSKPHFELHIGLADEGGKTKVTWRMIFETPEECAQIKSYAAPANEQNFDRLAAELEMLAQCERPFVFTRVIDAPREFVWKAWTQREELLKWWGGKAAPLVACNMDFREGGATHYAMALPDGRQMWGKWTYRRISEPDRLTLITNFSDEKGGVTRHPFALTWPLSTLSTMYLIPHGDKTLVRLQWVPFNATPDEVKTFDAAHAGMTQGISGTFDQLAAYAASVKK